MNSLYFTISKASKERNRKLRKPFEECSRTELEKKLKTYGEIDFYFSLKIFIIQILSKISKRLKFPDNDADATLNLDLCMK